VQQAFAQSGVAEIAEFFTATEFASLRQHVDGKVCHGLFGSPDGDAQVEGAPCEYADPVAERLLSVKASYLGNLLHLDLVPTYSYLRLYRPGDRVAAHRDRPACEITVAASLASDPQWPLHILIGGQALDCCPLPRGAVTFRGHELLHWRDTLSPGDPVAHVMFHYVQRDGPHRSWAYDRRPGETRTRAKQSPC
jgi:hypothetical protein